MSFSDVSTDVILAEGDIPGVPLEDVPLPPPVLVKQEPDTGCNMYCSKVINPSRFPPGMHFVAPGYKLGYWRYNRSRKDKKHIKNIFSYLMK